MSDISWHRLDLPADLVVEHLSDDYPGSVVVSGLRDGKAYAGQLEPDGELTEIAIPAAAATHGSARVVRRSGSGVMGVCGAVGLWGRETDPSRGGVSAETQAYPVPRDERGADPAWVWVTAGDEELLATVAYPAGEGHELRPLDLFTRRLMPFERRLVTAVPLDALHVAGFAGRVTVAGPITDGRTLTVWWAPCALLDPAYYRPDPLPWLHNPFRGPPDHITAASDGDAMSWYAGISAHGNVALWDSEGGLREVTDVHADRDDPVVLIAEAEGWGSYGEGDEPGGLAAFVAQTPDGNVLSFLGTTYDLPHGRIRGAVLNRGYDRPRCFVLVDEGLHVGELEY